MAAADEVEERRRELERARLASLPQEGRHERRLGVGGRLLLVLAVIARLELAPEEPEHECRDQEGRKRPDRKQEQRRSPRARDRIVDALLVALVVAGVGELLARDLLEPGAVLEPHARRRGERLPRVERPELHELPGRDVECAQKRFGPLQRDIAPHPDGMAPGADDVARAAHRRSEPAQALLPLVAPDLEVDVDDVVVADREAREPVVDDERPLLDAVRREAPDDPRPPAEVLDAEGARRAARLELRRRAGLERAAALRHADLVEALPRAERDLAEAVGERPRERDGDRLVDGDRAVGTDVCPDVARDELVGLAVGDSRERERGSDCRREDAEPTCHRVRRPRRARRAGPGARERQVPPARRSRAEVDLRGLALRHVGLEELALLEPERPGEHDPGERLDRVVEREHRVVVDLPRDGDPVLRPGQLVLELPEVLVRLQLRIGLGDREEAAERRAEDPFRGRGLGGPLRPLGVRARLGHGLERAALVLRVAAHRLDEVRDQVPAPLELHLDLRPRVVDAVPQPDEPVVEHDQPEDEQRDDHEDDDPHHRADPT